MDWAALLALIRLNPILVNGLGVFLAILLRQNVIESSVPIEPIYALFAAGYLGVSGALVTALAGWLVELGRARRQGMLTEVGEINTRLDEWEAEHGIGRGELRGLLLTLIKDPKMSGAWDLHRDWAAKYGVEAEEVRSLSNDVNRARILDLLVLRQRGVLGFRFEHEQALRTWTWPIQVFPAFAIAAGVPLGAIIASPVT